MQHLKRPLIFMVGFVLVLGGSIHQHSFAQSPEVWAQAINLSQSGAATQPRLVATPAGDLQVFWWDRFDGLVTSIGQLNPQSGEYTWTGPLLAPISSEKLTTTPSLFLDTDGNIHAFWTESAPAGGQPGTESQFTPPPVTQLMHSETAFGNSNWSFPDPIAESIAGYSVVTPISAGVTVAYFRNRHTPDVPAGVYIKQYNSATKGWASSRIVHASIYFRLISYPNAQISLLDAGDRHYYLAWYDPHQKLSLISRSDDGGNTWLQAQVIGNSEDQPIEPRLINTGKPGVIWQASAQGGCELLQNEIQQENQGQQSELKQIVWGKSSDTLEDLTACPKNDRFFYDQGHIVWVWHEGTSNVALTTWDDTQGKWSQVVNLSFSFEDRVSQQSISLNELYLALANSRIYVVGTDVTNSEIWLTYANVNSVEFIYKTSSLWSKVQPVTEPDSAASIPALAIDDQNQVHLVWDQGTRPSSKDRSLYYAVFAQNTLSKAIEIFPASPGEINRQPSILYSSANDSLQLTWSGGKEGEIYYSWSSAQEARSPSGWSAPKLISKPGAAASPQIGQDSLGTLYILYIVPLNEGRGVYLVQSTDLGKTWSQPVTVFSAENANWPMISHPTLAVSSNGVIHAAWVQKQLPDLDTSLGVYYSRSTDQGKTWSPVLSLTGTGYDWPRLALSEGKVHLIFARVDDGNGNLYHRWAAIHHPTEDSSSWSTPLSIPGWREISLPFGLAASGPADISSEQSPSTLHLIGTTTQSGTLRYSTWDGGQWSSAEEINAHGQIRSGLGINAFCANRGGILAVGWLGTPYQPNHGQQSVLFFTSREIPTFDLPNPGIVTPQSQATTPTVTSILIQEPTVTPTSTPDLNAISTSRTSSFPLPPLLMGGILAAIVVAGMFTARLLFSRTSDRPNHLRTRTGKTK